METKSQSQAACRGVMWIIFTAAKALSVHKLVLTKH